ncbi:hypothetical protein E2562_026688 [Oryza meyeriana var. granulata]|uniref:Uncharacterized protein n=1 Tax=Oryza meyeriana var. granulata TaxID=110450 RepID=A0A6G1E4I9_9ORYZ|nr:hypothetical protein E2562_026688 [Oryza meyeriana var. granulata]
MNSGASARSRLDPCDELSWGTGALCGTAAPFPLFEGSSRISWEILSGTATGVDDHPRLAYWGALAPGALFFVEEAANTPFCKSY